LIASRRGRAVLLSLSLLLGAAGLVARADVAAALGLAPAGLGVALIFSLPTAGVVAALVSAAFARRARRLTSMVQHLALTPGGELPSSPAELGPDEFAELGRSLEQLGRRLRVSVAGLREERDRLSGIIASMQEGVLLLDATGRLALVNPALREMVLLGSDAIGKTQLEAIRNAELKELLDRAQRSAEPVSGEIDVNGLKPRRLQVHAAQVHGAEGETFAVFADVTDVRRLESMRRDFVANVSHELRTPVTAIRSAAETLQAGVPRDPEVLAQFIAIIERNAARLQDLVEDVLELSRIESQKLKLTMEELDLRVVYGQVLGLFRERAERKQIALVNEATGSATHVLADRRALEHVLTNLVDNALKYCGSGSRVRIGALETSDGVRLFVADNGPGIEARHLPRIFERFYRVDAGRSREVGGTGLGLSIVKHLVDAMGGSVEATSAADSGTTFSVLLRKGSAVTQAVA
jgi:two-component system phosphate regulon sensor histidine kinase PhoR